MAADFSMKRDKKLNNLNTINFTAQTGSIGSMNINNINVLSMNLGDGINHDQDLIVFDVGITDSRLHWKTNLFGSPNNDSFLFINDQMAQQAILSAYSSIDISEIAAITSAPGATSINSLVYAPDGLDVATNNKIFLHGLFGGGSTYLRAYQYELTAIYNYESVTLNPTAAEVIESTYTTKSGIKFVGTDGVDLKANVITDNGAGFVTLDSGIQLPTSTGTPSTLDYYEDLTVSSVPMIGIWTVEPQLTTVRLIRTGKVVTMTIDSIIAASNHSGTIFTSVAPIPARFYPQNPGLNIYYAHLQIGAGNVPTPGIMGILGATGVITFELSSFTAVTGGGTMNGFYTTAVSWIVA